MHIKEINDRYYIEWDLGSSYGIDKAASATDTRSSISKPTVDIRAYITAAHMYIV